MKNKDFSTITEYNHVVILTFAFFASITLIPLFILAIIGSLLIRIGNILQRPFNFLTIWIAVINQELVN